MRTGCAHDQESDADVWDRPEFLDLPTRDPKPRTRGLTHVLDKGGGLPQIEGFLECAGDFVDVVKIGWGISYVDPVIKDRVSLYQSAGALVCTGGTLVEIALAQGRLHEFRRWVAAVGFGAVEVSNGLSVLTPAAKHALVAELSSDVTVLAETGAKDQAAAVSPEQWVREMLGDLEAGARWVIAEGRESGTVGLYEMDGTVRTGLCEALTARLPEDRIIFEAPRKTQQAWFIDQYGTGVNLGNIALEDVLPLETLRLGLRADTAHMHMQDAPASGERFLGADQGTGISATP